MKVLKEAEQVKNVPHDVVSAGDSVEASLACRVGCILRQGAGL